ncbi:MAG: MotA/TolQ/ExbB proton channel family protein [Porticoccus sp.]|nr:MotA/TolQ/ExbB proton channel family protein [Porticoccus sp.]
MTNISGVLIMGGPIVWLLFLFSVIALTIILLKSWQFWQLRQNSKATVEQALSRLEEGRRSQAIMLVNGQTNTRASLFAQALHLFDDCSFSFAEAKDEIMRRARLAIARLGYYLRALEVIASLAPLLGLLGTVMGMIEAFQAMEAAGSQVNPSVLSGGIWKALLTTAIGVAVAIPVSIIHSWFERKIEVQATLVQDDLEKLFTLEKQKDFNRSPREVEAGVQ